MAIHFGVAGLGPVKDAIANLERFHKLGIQACEIAFTYGIYIKNKEDAVKIGEAAKKFGIKLSIHAPYWINLNSKEKIKIEQSKVRILNCLKVGTWLDASRVVFHAGFYSGMERPIAYANIKKQILEIKKTAKAKKYTPLLCPETMGKINVFGSVDEIISLVKDTNCSFCIDFAHILAREKNYFFKETLKKFARQKSLHIHFSGIEYGEKGERKHILTSRSEVKILINALPKGKDVTIINESPNPVGDAVMSIQISKKLA